MVIFPRRLSLVAKLTNGKAGNNCYLLIDKLIGGGFFPLANSFFCPIIGSKKPKRLRKNGKQLFYFFIRIPYLQTETLVNPPLDTV